MAARRAARRAHAPPRPAPATARAAPGRCARGSGRLGQRHRDQQARPRHRLDDPGADPGPARDLGRRRAARDPRAPRAHGGAPRSGPSQARASAAGTRPSFGAGGSSAAGTLSTSFKAAPSGASVTAATCSISRRSGGRSGGASSRRRIGLQPHRRRAGGAAGAPRASQTAPITWRGPNGTSTRSPGASCRAVRQRIVERLVERQRDQDRNRGSLAGATGVALFRLARDRLLAALSDRGHSSEIDVTLVPSARAEVGAVAAAWRAWLAHEKRQAAASVKAYQTDLRGFPRVLRRPSGRPAGARPADRPLGGGFPRLARLAPPAGPRPDLDRARAGRAAQLLPLSRPSARPSQPRAQGAAHAAPGQAPAAPALAPARRGR